MKVRHQSRSKCLPIMPRKCKNGGRTAAKKRKREKMKGYCHDQDTLRDANGRRFVK